MVVPGCARECLCFFAMCVCRWLLVVYVEPTLADLGVADDQVDIWKEISAWLDVHTVPQIFFNDRHIGGFSELSALEDAGELDALLLDS